MSCHMKQFIMATLGDDGDKNIYMYIRVLF